jgi:hypothetical protein
MYPVEIKLDGHGARFQGKAEHTDTGGVDSPGFRETEMKALSLILAFATAFAGCQSNRPDAKVAQDSKSVSLDRGDIQQIVTVVVDDALRDAMLSAQPSIPLKVDGYSGSLPDRVLGRPVCKLDDVDAFLNNHYKADDIATNNVLVLHLLEQNQEGVRLSVFLSRGWGGCTKAELWVMRTEGSWRLGSLVSRQEML